MPSSSPGSITIVGAGLAGAQTAAALRSHGFTGHLSILGAEGVPPYDRPPLSKELLIRTDPLWISDDLGVDLSVLADDVRLDDPATRLTVTREGVATRVASSDTIGSDAVVLACGAEPVIPPGWDAAAVLHDHRDAEALRAAIAPGMRLVIVGAGWIGAEVAGVAAGAGAEVTVVEAGTAPLERQLGGTVGAHLAPWFTEAGVRLVTGTSVEKVSADGVRATSGEHFGADLVLAAVGARPASRWLRGSLPLDVRGGLRVNRAGRLLGVSMPGDPAGRLHGDALERVWAVGDIATRDHPVFGPVPGGHWSAALHDPEQTARAMLGVDERPADPEPVRARLGLEPLRTQAPYVFSRQLGHDLALFGVPSPFEEVAFRGDPTAPGGRWAAFYVEHSMHRHPKVTDQGHHVARVRAVLLADSPREVGQVRKLMNRPEPLIVDLEKVVDPSVRLRDAVL
ncbi:NAD(P)/FAD-dependent oxidoreductase [Myceligenerans pegani]|uniref:FAD-dependent oxidoreductase n=1 Tax=Myceligenerans pegani TaxID=2776917 RepID=A0ABR9MVH7_9MICO|nr:FAD-dependent oxidoreductase [Myceligenerans sp. TRM 65318]MBE1874762.1 FAD-dependent oxidoreductase [Myceligenerans sp. TRM 65318]MBE3017033.1 FAD-dependent oxidoreductase [Myceligenerans sp. TRM 65318]